MATSKKPPRSWDIDDLKTIGRRGKVTYLKAVPVLFLEKWVREGREERGKMKKGEFILAHGESAWYTLVESVLHEIVRKHYSPIAETTREDVIDHEVITNVLTLLGFKKTDSLLDAKELIHTHIPKEHLTV